MTKRLPWTTAMLYIPLFAVSVLVGTIAGNILRSNHRGSYALSENITVTNNNQPVYIEQPTIEAGLITKTSTVTVKNEEAEYGYTLTAELTNNPIANSTVSIYTSPASSSTPSPVQSTLCTESSPCILSNNGTSTGTIDILETEDDNATGDIPTLPDGETSIWTITITIPQNTIIGNYILDIAYNESTNPQPIVPPPGPTTDLGAMQLLTNTNCPEDYKDETNKIPYTAFDARNGQIYYVKKILGTGPIDPETSEATDLCWMHSNLRYAGNGDWDESWGYDDDRYSATASITTPDLDGNTESIDPAITPNENDGATAGTGGPLTIVSGSQASSYTVAQIANPGGDTDYTNTTANGGFYGYLYNWCAAMGGQASACQSSTATQPSTATTVCPAGWRLPTGEPTTGEFTALNTIVNSKSTTSDSGLRSNFLAVYAGYFGGGISGFSNVGSASYFWSSTTASFVWFAYTLHHGVSYVGMARDDYKHSLFTVRCVLD